MSGHKEAEEMLVMARKDLKALGHMWDPAKFDDAIFGFHAQQAIEKALKAWLSLRRRRYPFTHNLRALLALLEEEGCDAGRFMHVLRYSVFAIQFRYEEAVPVVESLDREAAIADAKAVVEHVARLIADAKPDAE
jgi:HEPN domain-containing protein